MNMFQLFSFSYNFEIIASVAIAIALALESTPNRKKEEVVEEMVYQWKKAKTYTISEGNNI